MPSRFKRRLGAVLLALAVLALVGLALVGLAAYYDYTKPKPVRVLWQAELTKQSRVPIYMDIVFAQIAPLPNGGVAIAGKYQLALFNSSGEPVQNMPTPQGTMAPITFGKRRVADDAGNVYFAYGDRLLSYDEQGRQRWEWTLPSATREDGKPDDISMYQVTPEGTVIIASDTGYFFEVYSKGTTLHQASSDLTLRGLVAFYKSDDGGYFLADTIKKGVRDKGVARIASDGTEVWQKSFKGFAVHSLSVCGGLGIVSMHNGEVHALNADGDDVWTYQVPPGVVTGGPTIHEIYPCDDRLVFIVTDGRLAALDLAGNVLWTLDGNYMLDVAVASADRQYLLELHESKMLSGLYTWYLKRYPNQYGNIPDPPVTQYITRVDHGRVTKRWRAPAGSSRLAGPGAHGEYYVIGDGTLYCVSLD